MQSKSTRKLSPVQQAYERCKPARDALRQMDGQCMEVVEDKAGILCERWYIVKGGAESPQRTINLIVYATPHWWDVFAPVSASADVADTIAAIKALAA